MNMDQIYDLCLKLNLITLNVETSGLDPEKDRVLEFCFADPISGRPIAQGFVGWDDFDADTQNGAKHLNGIGSADLASGCNPLDFAIFCSLIAEQEFTIVAHNAAFDIAMIASALRRVGAENAAESFEQIRYLDTMLIWKAFKPTWEESDSAAAAREHFGIKHPPAHKAAGVCKATTELLVAELLEWGEKIPSDPEYLAEWQHAIRREKDAEVASGKPAVTIPGPIVRDILEVFSDDSMRH